MDQPIDLLKYRQARDKAEKHPKTIKKHKTKAQGVARQGQGQAEGQGHAEASCSECGFVPDSPADLVLCLDAPDRSTSQSGRYQCPQCLHFFNRASIFDGCITGDRHGITITVQWELLREIFAQYDFEESLFSIGAAFTNAARDIVETYAKDLVNNMYGEEE